MNRPVIEPDVAVAVEPRERMLEPILIVSLQKIFPRVGAAAFVRPIAE